MLFIHLHKGNFFALFGYSNRIICTLNISSANCQMIVNEIGDFVFENVYKRSGFVKKGGIIQLGP